MDSLLAAHRGVTWFLTGLIWYVQLVHYPSFAGWARESFAAWHATHTRGTTLIVAPTMLLELLLASYFLWAPPPTWSRPRAIAGVVLVLVNATATYFIMMPMHQRLSQGFDEETIRALVGWNWLRTAAWTLRAVLVA